MNKGISPEHRVVSEFYDTVYYDHADGSTSPRRHLRRLANRLGIRQDERVLDVACGTGEWLQAVHDCGARVSGIDISSKAIDLCLHRFPSGDFHVGVAEDLPFPDKHFDLVTCLGSLEHFLDQLAALREMIRVASTDARFLILVPNSGFPTYHLGIYRGTQQQAIRETIRSLDEWNGLFSQAGLRVVDRWRDLHVLSRSWILRRPFFLAPLRLAQALALAAWPLEWQYQVYFLCLRSKTSNVEVPGNPIAGIRDLGSGGYFSL